MSGERMSIACPLECGFEGALEAHDAAGVPVFVCPHCLGIALDGAVLTDPRRPVDLSRTLRPIIETVSQEFSVDPVTQVKNRRFFLQRLSVELAAARHRHFVSLAAFVVDMAPLYSAGGSRDGDAALRAIATFLLSSVRTGDNFGRVESNVFGLILPHADDRRAGEITQRILEKIYDHEFRAPSGRVIPLSLKHAVITLSNDEDAEAAWTRLMQRLFHRGSGL